MDKQELIEHARVYFETNGLQVHTKTIDEIISLCAKHYHEQVREAVDKLPEPEPIVPFDVGYEEGVKGALQAIEEVFNEK